MRVWRPFTKDRSSQGHRWRRLLQLDFDRKRSTRATQRWRDLAHLAGGLDTRITNKFDLNRNVSIDGLVAEHRFIHVKDRIAWTVMGQNKDALPSRHHLTNLRVSRGDRPSVAGAKFCLRQGVTRRSKLSFCGIERALRGAEGLLRAIILRSRIRLARKQEFLPLQVGGLVAKFCLSSTNVGFRCIDSGLLLVRIELREDLAGKDVIANIHQPFGDPAIGAETEIRLHLRAYLTS